jgi:hypothetical protein
MASEWKVSDGVAPPRWKVGLFVWKINGAWRLRLYRPWRKKKFVEIQSEKLLLALYILGIGADWWEDKVDWRNT